MSTRLLSAALLSALLAAPLTAQSAQRWSVQVSGLGVGVFGKAYDGLENGYGFEAQARVTPSLWSYGFGLQYSAHGLSGDGFDESVGLTGVFFEPRRVFDIGSARVAPYMSGRLSYLRQSADLDVTLSRLTRSAEPVSLSLQQRRATLALSASGFQGNVGGGVLVRMSPRVNLDLGATLGLIRFGDTQAEVDGEDAGTFEGTSGTGQNLLVRVGLAIGLGSGAAKPQVPSTGSRTRR
jgi:hypothetical protein